MSKRTRIEAPALASWEEAAQAVRRVGEIDIESERVEGEADLQVNEIKAAAAARISALKAEKKNLVARVQQFAEARRPDFGAKRSMRLVFGEIGWRASTRLKMVLKRPQIIERLRARDLLSCLRIKTGIDAKRLAEQPEEVLTRVGCALEHVEAFWVEPDRQKIEEART